MKSRFDYVKYDEDSCALQGEAKDRAQELEEMIQSIPSSSGNVVRYKALALTTLEECYMWIGKAIRDDQIERNKVELVQTELQEERTNS